MDDRVLVLAGKMGAGKDTMTDRTLRDPTVCNGFVGVKLGLTDEVKDLIASWFGADLKVLHGTAEQKAAQLPSAKEGVTYREALRVVVGAFDYLEPGILVRQFYEVLNNHRRRSQWPLFVVCNDLRRRRDAELMKGKGAKIVRLTRSSPLCDAHHTETELDDWDGFDAVVDNRDKTETATYQELLGHFSDWGWYSARV